MERREVFVEVEWWVVCRLSHTTDDEGPTSRLASDGPLTGSVLWRLDPCHCPSTHLPIHYYYNNYYYHTRFKHVKSFTKVKNIKCERSQCHRRNARLCRAVLSLDLKVAMLTVMSEVTVSESLFQTRGAAWQKAILEKLRVARLHWRKFAPRGLSCLGASYIRISSAKYCGSCLVSALNAISWSVLACIRSYNSQ